jgi:hypothetical protein
MPELLLMCLHSLAFLFAVSWWFKGAQLPILHLNSRQLVGLKCIFLTTSKLLSLPDEQRAAASSDQKLPIPIPPYTRGKEPTYLLPRSNLEDGISYLGSGSRLRAFLSKLASGMDNVSGSPYLFCPQPAANETAHSWFRFINVFHPFAVAKWVLVVLPVLVPPFISTCTMIFPDNRVHVMRSIQYIQHPHSIIPHRH